MTSNGEDKLPKWHNTVFIIIIIFLLLRFISVKAKLAFTVTKLKDALEPLHSCSHGGNSLLNYKRDGPRRCIKFSKQDDIDNHQLWIHLPPQAFNFFSYLSSVTDGYYLVSSDYSSFIITKNSLALYRTLHNDSEQVKKPWLSKDGLLITFQLFIIFQAVTSSSLRPLVNVERKLSA